VKKLFQHIQKSIIPIIFVALINSVIGLKAQDDRIDSVDLRIDRDGIFIFYDAPLGSSTTGQPLAIGDLNNNKCGDIIVGAQNASFAGAEGWRNNAGHLRIIMDVCTIDGQINMADTSDKSTQIITVLGAQAEDMLGTEITVADFNSDDYDDVLVGAQNHGGINNARLRAGAAYVIWGSSSFNDLSEINLSEPNDSVLTIYGADSEDRLGLWVDHGDFNADDYADMLIGANQADGIDNSRINAGEVWIIYGGEDIQQFGSSIDMRQPPVTSTRINGIDYDDLFGSTVLGGDLNNDGYSDVIASAALWRGSAGIGGIDFGGGDGPNNTRYNGGDTYVIFGNKDLQGKVIDLATKLASDGSPIDESIAVVYGVDSNDLMGEELAVGDLDGDGRNDLVLGSLVTGGVTNRMDEAGEAWIIYGNIPFEGQAIDLANPSNRITTVIYPDQPSSKGGDILRVGDLDNDGVDDLFYGAPNYDPSDNNNEVRKNAGLLAIIYGIEGRPISETPLIIPSAAPDNLRISYIIGTDAEDMMAYGLAIYDVNGDGILDIAPNGMGGDGIDNTIINAGEIYVIDGALFLSKLSIFSE